MVDYHYGLCSNLQSPKISMVNLICAYCNLHFVGCSDARHTSGCFQSSMTCCQVDVPDGILPQAKDPSSGPAPPGKAFALTKGSHQTVISATYCCCLEPSLRCIDEWAKRSRHGDVFFNSNVILHQLQSAMAWRSVGPERQMLCWLYLQACGGHVGELRHPPWPIV